jgi:hypothetical protein
VSTLLALAAGASGALAGFVLGVGWAVARLPGASKPLAALVVAVAVGFDVMGLPRPLCSGRQVPRSWARLLPLRIAALLYGARLGVGPATILPTWLWWAAALLGAATGPGWSTATGAAFGLARTLVMPAVAAWAEGDMASHMDRLRLRERIGRPVSLLAAAGVVVAVLLTACTDRGDGGRATTSGGPGSGEAAAAGDVAAEPPGPSVDGSLLLTDVGPEYVQVPDDQRAGLGPLDLDAAARVEADTSAERSLLATRGFRRGLARAWRTQAGDELYQAVYEFGDEAGAAAYLQDGLITLEGSGATRYPVEGVPGATGFSQAERRPTGAVTSHGVVFVRGPRFFLVFASSARPGTTPGAVAEVAKAADARQAAAAAPTAVGGGSR